MIRRPVLIRITTVPVSLKLLLKGQMRYMHSNGFKVIMVSANGKEAKEVTTQEGCEHIPIPFKRNISPLQDIYCLVLLIRLFRRIRPDIVHTHTPKAGLLGMMAAFFCGVPVRLHTIAGLPWINFKGISKYLMKQSEKLTILLANSVYPNSFNLMKVLEDNNIGSNKMKVIGNGSSNGIDTSFFSKDLTGVKERSDRLLMERNIKPTAAVWVFIGRLVKDKGIDELLKAFIKLKEEFQDDELWLVGDEEPQRDPLTVEQIKCIQQNDSIVKWGYQNDVRPFLAASGLLVFPSYREGFPNVPLQAAAMECTMIVTDINGCNEIVKDKFNGLLIPSQDKESLFNAMLQIRRDERLRKFLSANARSYIKDKFDQQYIWGNILGEYTFWLNKKRVKCDPTLVNSYVR